MGALEISIMSFPYAPASHLSPGQAVFGFF